MMFVRCIEGPAAGEELRFNQKLEYFSVPEHPDMDFCKGCEPPDAPDVPGFHVCEYRVFPIRFDTGHVHYYAIPAKTTLVSQFNNIWFGYQKWAEHEKQPKPHCLDGDV